ncbi:hypothetical protein HJC23_011402 [Cyclotella cryptica]|uniref:PUB domain-containing protein n=1 Tax=Cyclotella cryptica TaxID=29204 RepID=A0ABD3PQR5_9STRA
MSLPNAPGTHLQNLILDDKSTSAQKLSCLKTLRIVLKNLVDPIKASDPKYRQIKLSKVASRFDPCPSSMEYLQAIGFALAEEDGEDVLRISNVNSSDMEASLFELNAAIDIVSPNDDLEEKKSELDRTSSTLSASSSVASSTGGRMSEKQKARMLMEKKRMEEAEEAKKARQKTRDQIRQDKYVRENDENWTSKQSAACVKSGTGISTFRDKYGEH